MTIYQTETPFNYEKYKEYVCSSVCKRSENCVRVSMCLYECLKHHLGHNEKNYGYSPKTWMNIDKDGNVIIEKGDSFGMCHLYSLLDNFNSYYGAVNDGDYLTILSVGSSLTHKPNKDGWYNENTMSVGFGVVINKLTNDIVLVTLGEDDGNYWGSHEIPYENLSKYDRNEVIRIINDVDESHFWNKQELIEKLWYYGKN